jgi:hypothetical protein
VDDRGKTQGEDMSEKYLSSTRMSVRRALLRPTLVAALLILSLDASRAASLPGLNSPDSAAQPVTTIARADVENRSDALYDNGDFIYQGGGTKKAVHPQLKPDYPCQNLHVRELSCPPR